MFDLWDIQLNEVWAVLRQMLPQADMEALTAEELEWIAWKEEQIALTGEEAGGGSLAIMLQAQRAAELTRSGSMCCWNILHDKARVGAAVCRAHPRFAIPANGTGPHTPGRGPSAPPKWPGTPPARCPASARKRTPSPRPGGKETSSRR